MMVLFYSEIIDTAANNNLEKETLTNLLVAGTEGLPKGKKRSASNVAEADADIEMEDSVRSPPANAKPPQQIHPTIEAKTSSYKDDSEYIPDDIPGVSYSWILNKVKRGADSAAEARRKGIVIKTLLERATLEVNGENISRAAAWQCLGSFYVLTVEPRFNELLVIDNTFVDVNGSQFLVTKRSVGRCVLYANRLPPNTADSVIEDVLKSWFAKNCQSGFVAPQDWLYTRAQQDISVNIGGTEQCFKVPTDSASLSFRIPHAETAFLGTLKTLAQKSYELIIPGSQKSSVLIVKLEGIKNSKTTAAPKPVTLPKTQPSMPVPTPVGKKKNKSGKKKTQSGKVAPPKNSPSKPPAAKRRDLKATPKKQGAPNKTQPSTTQGPHTQTST
jgi:hypothetical protein